MFQDTELFGAMYNPFTQMFTTPQLSQQDFTILHTQSLCHRGQMFSV